MNEQRMQGSPQVARWFVCLGLAFCLLGSRDALAGKWPGEGASFGGAIAARVIGQLCPSVLSTSDIALFAVRMGFIQWRQPGSVLA